MTYSFPNTDENELDLKYKFGDDITYKIAFQNTPLIAYDYIDLDKTDYCFHQKCFSNFDAKKYFAKLKEISSKKIDQLLDDYKGHFHIYNKVPRNLLRLFEKVFGGDDSTFLKPEIIPPFGQIALYTNPNGSDKGKGIKSPRIYFILGKFGVFHILFYDPYHEINPGK
jgi:hypothetical protein